MIDCYVRIGTHLTESSHDSDDMYMTHATHVFNTQLACTHVLSVSTHGSSGWAVEHVCCSPVLAHAHTLWSGTQLHLPCNGTCQSPIHQHMHCHTQGLYYEAVGKPERAKELYEAILKDIPHNDVIPKRLVSVCE